MAVLSRSASAVVKGPGPRSTEVGSITKIAGATGHGLHALLRAHAMEILPILVPMLLLLLLLIKVRARIQPCCWPWRPRLHTPSPAGRTPPCCWPGRPCRLPPPATWPLKVLPDPRHLYLTVGFCVRQSAREDRTTSTTPSNSSPTQRSPSSRTRNKGLTDDQFDQFSIPSPPLCPLRRITSLPLRLRNLTRRHSPCIRVHRRRSVAQDLRHLYLAVRFRVRQLVRSRGLRRQHCQVPLPPQGPLTPEQGTRDSPRSDRRVLVP